MTTHLFVPVVGDVVRVSTSAGPDYSGRVGIVTEAGPGDDEFRVEFEDGATPTTGYLSSASLEPMLKE